MQNKCKQRYRIRTESHNNMPVLALSIDHTSRLLHRLLRHLWKISFHFNWDYFVLSCAASAAGDVLYICEDVSSGAQKYRYDYFDYGDEWLTRSKHYYHFEWTIFESR